MDIKTKPSAGAYLLLNAQIIPLQKSVTTIGRLLENDVVINDPGVSRFHAEIQHDDGMYILEDKDSTGGTLLNNKPIRRVRMYSGDLISLAGIPLMFVLDSASIAAQTRESTGKLDEVTPQPIDEDTKSRASRDE